MQSRPDSTRIEHIYPRQRFYYTYYRQVYVYSSVLFLPENCKPRIHLISHRAECSAVPSFFTKKKKVQLYQDHYDACCADAVPLLHDDEQQSCCSSRPIAIYRERLDTNEGGFSTGLLNKLAGLAHI